MKQYMTILYVIIIAAALAAFSWLVSTELDEILQPVLSSVLTIGLVGFTVYIVQRNKKRFHKE